MTTDNNAAGRPLRWGIVSTAKIGRDHVVPALLAADNCEIVAVGSRELGAARAFADDFGIARAHGSYDALIADPDVDAIYNPLPNHLHGPVSLDAARQGVHVLCEKPLTLNADEAEAVAAEIDGLDVVAMEAFMYQFHPQWALVLDMVRAGRIGEIVSVQTWFSYFGDDPSNIRHNPAWGGGALMDIGCYAISSARRIFDAEPDRVQGSVQVHPTYGVDVTASGILDFGDRHASFTVATQSDGDQRVTIVGTEGRIEVARPFNAQRDREMVVRVGTGMGATFGEPLEEIRFAPADQYQLMVEAFAAAVLACEPSPVPLSDAVANMRVIDAVFAAANFTMTDVADQPGITR